MRSPSTDEVTPDIDRFMSPPSHDPPDSARNAQLFNTWPGSRAYGDVASLGLLRAGACGFIAVGEDAKLGAAGLIMAILGGSVMPPRQGAIIDVQTVSLGGVSFPAVRASFVLVVICFAVIAPYGWRTAAANRPTTPRRPQTA